jgi:hypothetical protein
VDVGASSGHSSFEVIERLLVFYAFRFFTFVILQFLKVSFLRFDFLLRDAKQDGVGETGKKVNVAGNATLCTTDLRNLAHA